MRLVAWLATGFVLWIVIWAITGKGFDALLVFLVIVLLASTYELAVKYLPARD